MLCQHAGLKTTTHAAQRLGDKEPRCATTTIAIVGTRPKHSAAQYFAPCWHPVPCPSNHGAPKDCGTPAHSAPAPATVPRPRPDAEPLPTKLKGRRGPVHPAQPSRASTSHAASSADTAAPTPTQRRGPRHLDPPSPRQRSLQRPAGACARYTRRQSPSKCAVLCCAGGSRRQSSS